MPGTFAARRWRRVVAFYLLVFGTNHGLVGGCLACGLLAYDRVLAKEPLAWPHHSRVLRTGN